MVLEISVGPVVRQLVGDILRIAVDQVTSRTILGGNEERAALWVGLRRRLGIDIPARISFRTAGEAADYLERQRVVDQ